MILKTTLRDIVRSQKSDLSLPEPWIEREKLNELDLSLPHAHIISGIRRCGKSTLLNQLMKNVKRFYYFNFEDPRSIDFEASDFEKLDEVFKEEYGDSQYYFFDEIQNVEHWERFVRLLMDRKKKVIITGSNASLLSKELGTKLTGRHLQCELFPFSYKEMLAFVNKRAGIESFEEYFINGGFPEYLLSKKTEVLQELFRDIIGRDIIVRHKLRIEKIVQELAIFLLTNSGKQFSYNGLRKMFGFGSTNSAVSFVSYFEDTYLLFTIPKFDYSLKKQLVNPKKVYSIDTGLSKCNSTSFSSDRGRVLENIVFLHLRKKYKSIFYFKKEYECDFLVREKEKIAKAYQVCYQLDEDNKDREVKGLIEALDNFKLAKGLILTYNQEDHFKIKGKEIFVKPVWEWFGSTEN